MSDSEGVELEKQTQEPQNQDGESPEHTQEFLESETGIFCGFFNPY